MAARLELLKGQFFDSDGDPLTGGLIYTYQVGTTTAKATYTSASADTEQANPIVLNSRGEADSDIYGDGYYKIVLKTSGGSTIWTIASVCGINTTSLTTIGDYSNDFDAAVTAISSTETTLYVDAASTMSTSVSAPATLTVVIEKGGSIDMDGNALTFAGPVIMNGGSIDQGTATLTFNGPLTITGGSFTHDGTIAITKSFECGLFDLGWDPSYTVSFSAGAVKEVFPQWWGALGDNSQDDTTMINAAAASITSGVLRIPSGIYKLNSKTAYTSANTSGTLYGQIVLNNDISIRGDGLSSRLNCTLDDTFYATLVVNGTNHTIVEGLYITGTNTAYSSNYGGGIRVELSGKTVIRDNYIKNTRGIAINYVGNSGGNAGSTGVDYYCAYTHTYNNTIEDCNDDGIYHIYSKYATISNNILDNVGYTDAILLEASDHSTVNNNIILYPNQRAILLNTGSSYGTVTGNTIYHYDASTVYNSIYLASVRYCTISNNVIRYADTGATPATAISMVPGTYSYTDTYHTISGNVIENAGPTTSILAIEVQTDYNLIVGNQLQGGAYGIAVDDANYNMIVANRLDVDAGNEIRLAGIDGRDDPTYTYVLNNYIGNGIYDANTTSTNIYKGNVPSSQELTDDSRTIMGSTYFHSEAYEINSDDNKVDMTLSVKWSRLL